MISLHFAEAKETLPENWESDVSIRAAAENYRDYLISVDTARAEFEKSNPDELYVPSEYPIIDEFTIVKVISTNKRKAIKYKCLEYLLGEKMYLDWKWNTPEVQQSYTKSKTAASDYYKQFETNPDGAVDYLDGLRDRTEYLNECKKIEKAIKETKL